MSTEMKALGLENESKLFDGLPPKQSASDNREGRLTLWRNYIRCSSSHNAVRFYEVSSNSDLIKH